MARPALVRLNGHARESVASLVEIEEPAVIQQERKGARVAGDGASHIRLAAQQIGHLVLHDAGALGFERLLVHGDARKGGSRQRPVPPEKRRRRRRLRRLPLERSRQAGIHQQAGKA